MQPYRGRLHHAAGPPSARHASRPTPSAHSAPRSQDGRLPREYPLRPAAARCHCRARPRHVPRPLKGATSAAVQGGLNRGRPTDGGASPRRSPPQPAVTAAACVISAGHVTSACHDAEQHRCSTTPSPRRAPPPAKPAPSASPSEPPARTPPASPSPPRACRRACRGKAAVSQQRPLQLAPPFLRNRCLRLAARKAPVRQPRNRAPISSRRLAAATCAAGACKRRERRDRSGPAGGRAMSLCRAARRAARRASHPPPHPCPARSRTRSRATPANAEGAYPIPVHFIAPSPPFPQSPPRLRCADRERHTRTNNHYPSHDPSHDPSHNLSQSRQQSAQAGTSTDPAHKRLGSAAPDLALPATASPPPPRAPLRAPPPPPAPPRHRPRRRRPPPGRAGRRRRRARRAQGRSGGARSRA